MSQWLLRGSIIINFPLDILSYNSVIFDCDGVILDSNRLKSEAFYECVKHYPPDIVNAFIGYHKANGGISRYAKFEHFLRNMVNNYSEVMLQHLLSEYQKITIDGLLRCPICDGCLDLIQYIYRRMQLFVVSGGSQEDLRHVFKKRDLEKYFVEIHGSPKTKVDILRDFSDRSLLAGNVLYIGDSRLDHQVAEEMKVDFVFVYKYTEFDGWEEYCRKEGVSYVKTLREIPSA